MRTIRNKAFGNWKGGCKGKDELYDMTWGLRELEQQNHFIPDQYQNSEFAPLFIGIGDWQQVSDWKTIMERQSFWDQP